MISDGTFYVLTVGRMYARDFVNVWTQQLAAAAKYKTLEKARKVAEEWAATSGDKQLSVQRITIETVEVVAKKTAPSGGRSKP